jgi:predicted secreted Zn-dependent protease
MKQFLAAVAIALTASANASIFKCTDGTYQDKPCAAGIEKSLDEAPKGIPIKIEFIETSSTYDIAQTSVHGVLVEMQQQQWMAYNSSKGYSITTKIEEKDKKCWITEATLRLSNDNHLPNWRYYSAADPQTKKYWDREMSNAVRHENTHRQISKEFLMFLKEKIAGIGSQPCHELPLRIKQEERQGWINLTERQANFDRREGGKTAKELWANGGPKR